MFRKLHRTHRLIHPTKQLFYCCSVWLRPASALPINRRTTTVEHSLHTVVACHLQHSLTNHSLTTSQVIASPQQTKYLLSSTTVQQHFDDIDIEEEQKQKQELEPTPEPVSKREEPRQPKRNTTTDQVQTIPPTAKTNDDDNTNLLQFSVLQRIKRDLQLVDVNQDGRLDFEEFQMLLEDYYDQVISEQARQELVELFFVGTKGQSVSHTTFLRAIQYTARHYHYRHHHHHHPSSSLISQSISEDSEYQWTRHDKYHVANDLHDEYPNSLEDSNPLRLEQLKDDRCWITREEKQNDDSAHQSLFYNTQYEFETRLLDYIEECKKRAMSEEEDEEKNQRN